MNRLSANRERGPLRLPELAALIAFALLNAVGCATPQQPRSQAPSSFHVTVSDSPTQRYLQLDDPQRRLSCLRVRIRQLDDLLSQHRQQVQELLEDAFEASGAAPGWGPEEWAEHETTLQRLRVFLEAYSQERSMAVEGRDEARQEIRRRERERQRLLAETDEV